MKTQQIIIIILVAVVATGSGFFGGMQYQKSQRPQLGQFGRQNGQAGQNGQGQSFRGNGQNGAMAVVGEILSIDDKSITVKLQDGSSKIVILSEKTSVNKQATGTKDDLKEGERVAVFGATNSDGSVTAQSIQLNPMIRGTGALISPKPTK